eukprot:4493208-Pleurochrysis_carterae.AAC.3
MLFPNRVEALTQRSGAPNLLSGSAGTPHAASAVKAASPFDALVHEDARLALDLALNLDLELDLAVFADLRALVLALRSQTPPVACKNASAQRKPGDRRAARLQIGKQKIARMRQH